MAFNKISLNSVEAQSVSQVTIIPAAPVDSVADQFDIFYHLGTNLQQSSFSNPNTVDISISQTGGSIIGGSLSTITDRISSAVVFSTAPTEVKIEFLNDFEVDLQSYAISDSTGTAGGFQDFILEGSTDNTNWVQLHQVSGRAVGAGAINLYYCESRYGFFKYFRFRNITFAVNNRIDDILFYGRLRNLVTGQAAIENTKDIFASYPSIDAANKFDNHIIRYDGTYWEPRIRFPFEVVKLVLTGDYTITSAYKPTFYVVSPNGANRTITLPTTPAKDDVIKIKNLDGAFDLTVEEFVGDPSPVVMNNAGKLQYEFVYDSVEWQVSG